MVNADAVVAAVVAAVATIIGVVLTTTRERSRLSILKRLAELRPHLEPGSDALADIRTLEDVLAAKLLKHYDFPVWKTCLVLLIPVALIGGGALVLASSRNVVDPGPGSEASTAYFGVAIAAGVAFIGLLIAAGGYHRVESRDQGTR